MKCKLFTKGVKNEKLRLAEVRKRLPGFSGKSSAYRSPYLYGDWNTSLHVWVVCRSLWLRKRNPAWQKPYQLLRKQWCCPSHHHYYDGRRPEVFWRKNGTCRKVDVPHRTSRSASGCFRKGKNPEGTWAWYHFFQIGFNSKKEVLY